MAYLRRPVLVQFFLVCSCLVSACFGDLHHLFTGSITPQLPKILPKIISNTSNGQIIEAIVSRCTSTLQVIEEEKLEQVPELALELANDLRYLSNKSWAKEQLNYSIDCWLKLRGVRAGEVNESIEKMLSLLTLADKQYAEKVKDCFADIADQEQLSRVQGLISIALENPDT